MLLIYVINTMHYLIYTCYIIKLNNKHVYILNFYHSYNKYLYFMISKNILLFYKNCVYNF